MDAPSNRGGPSAPSNARQPKVFSVFDFTTEALGELRLWLEQNPPSVPVSQLVGFSQFTAQVATEIGTSETTTSTTFTNLATTGPTLTGLSDGKYVILFGCQASTSAAGNIASMAISPNSTSLGGPPPIGGDCESRVTNLVSICRVITATLSNSGNNTLTAKYASDNAAATATFGSRWLIALRYANP